MRLFIAEKPSLGRAIAASLGVVKSEHDHITCENGDVVTWCAGHLLEQAEPEAYGEQYKTWSFDTLPIFPKDWILIPTDNGKKQLEAVVKQIKKATSLVNAGDPDREGDLLVNEVIEYANASSELKDSAMRVSINDLNPKAIQTALENLEPNSKWLPRSNAALCRSRADWLLGMNITRACSIIARRKGHDTVLHVGRVQTPTIQLVVKRDIEIANFKPVDFFEINAHFTHDNVAFKAKLQQEERCEKKDEAESMITNMVDQSAIVTLCETKRAKSQPPLPFSLRTLQETMSSKHGYGVKETLDIAQSLYEKHKITSYPRTDKNYLSLNKEDEIQLIIDNLEGLNDTPLAQWASDADLSLRSPCWNDKKLEGAAHTAIIPTTRAPDLEALNEAELTVYTAIASRYLAQFYPTAEDDNTTIKIQSGEHEFKTTGKVEIKKGWREVLGKEKNNTEEQALPSLTKDQSIDCTNAEVVSKKTSAPKPYTEGTLLTAMCNIGKDVTDPALKAKLKETVGLGTEATRAGIIGKALERKYLISKGKNIVSTPLAKMLIMALPNRVRDPAITAIWEQQLDVVERGECSVDTFIAAVEKNVQTLLDDLRSGKEPFTLPKSAAPACSQPNCTGFILPFEGKRGNAHQCHVCQTKFKDDNGKVGQAIKKIKKLDIKK
uniref:DNA topoisomerase n=1 Tax=Aliivibrio fischeri TaxID=668 RepID=A0A0H3ZSU7_ALIFS|nr:DNA topoisomerase III [Aliivibrio fischeri]